MISPQEMYVKMQFLGENIFLLNYTKAIYHVNLIDFFMETYFIGLLKCYQILCMWNKNYNGYLLYNISVNYCKGIRIS